MEKVLVILAAGMGSRYGGSKQTEQFGPNGEFIIDYSVFDAIKSGFNKIVFVIKKENYELFKSTIGSRIEKHVNVEYVFQDFSNVPSEYKIPSSRIKPLGTAHAVLCTKNKINSSFAIINADDFYGRNAFEVASNFIDLNNVSDIGIIGYNVENTLTENGSVKRGVIVEKNGILKEIIESSISKKDGNIEAFALDDNRKVEINNDTKVSMNFIVFPNGFINYIEKEFVNFLSKSNLESDEFLIPDVITKYKNEKLGNVRILNTTSKWVGVTYKEDKKSVQDYINSQIEKGVYKSNCWL